MLAQFLEEDEVSTDTGGPIGELSKDAAQNIRAELIPNVKGAIRISWAANLDVDDDFVVGRANDVLNTGDKALRAVSIRVVPIAAKTEVIDSNLTPGSYYYCVIAKKRIVNREILLYQNMNYTTRPVIIEREGYQPRKATTQQVSLIYARKMSKNHVLLAWRGIETRNIIYTVYRGRMPLDSPDKIRKAEIRKVITDGRESFVDKSFSVSGKYFYAVTTKSIEGTEDLNLNPDQSYTASGINIQAGRLGSVNNIKTFPMENQSIKITWSKSGTGITEFLIYRYLKPISDTNRLAQSVFIDSVKEWTTEFIDKNCGSGDCYYAVLAKLDTGNINNKLVRADNYTIGPVSLGKLIRVNSIYVAPRRGGVKIGWDFHGTTGNRNYKVYRSNRRISKVDDLFNAYVVDSVNVLDKKCMDRKPLPGMYYYAIVPDDAKIRANFELIGDVNITENPIRIRRKKEPEKPISRKVKKKPYLPEPEPEMVKSIPEIRKPKVSVPRPFVEKKTEVQWSGVDDILDKYFFPGQYQTSIDSLEGYMKQSDNASDVAKAKLFIARSLLELQKYREALDYLLLPDVSEHFPKESQFWKQYVISRLR